MNAQVKNSLFFLPKKAKVMVDYHNTLLINGYYDGELVDALKWMIKEREIEVFIWAHLKDEERDQVKEYMGKLIPEAKFIENKPEFDLIIDDKAVKNTLH